MNLFSQTPESLLERRLQELPGDENVTLKQAGQEVILKEFVSSVFDRGFFDSVRRVGTLEKVASSNDPFVEGQAEAVNYIVSMGQEPFAYGWYEFIKQAHDCGTDIVAFAKKATEEPPFVDNEAFLGGFMSAAAHLLETQDDLVKMAWEGPPVENDYITDEENEMDRVELYLMGKEAALNDLVELYESGGDISDCLQGVYEAVNSELEKNASEEDVVFRLGVENLCYSILKTAEEYYGTVDVVDHDVALEDILMKVAEEVEEQKAGLLRRTGRAIKAIPGKIRSGYRGWQRERIGGKISDAELEAKNYRELARLDGSRAMAMVPKDGVAPRWTHASSAHKNLGRYGDSAREAISDAQGYEAQAEKLRRKLQKYQD
jgi:hypothetical protein